MMNRVHIRRLPTGVAGLDSVLGGGLPELSFNLIAGGPGCGKTTLAHQLVFANATEEREALYFTIFGEPPVKMLRYQQQYDFFDSARVAGAVRFVHLGKELVEGGLAKVLERITNELATSDARTVVVDSFRSVARAVDAQGGLEARLDLERFVQLLALTLTSHEATTFLIGEYTERDHDSNPVFSVADGIIWLSQSVHRHSSVRRIQVVKMRGQSTVPGLHMLTIGPAGVRVYPRLPGGTDAETPASREKDEAPKKTGIVGLDEMLGGGIPSGSSVLVAGPSGSGKTTLATQFVLEGAAAGETSVIALFEKRPDEYLRSSSTRAELETLIESDKLGIAYVRPLDLSVDEVLEELHATITRLGARRVVVDSLSGFELALAPAFREDFRESLYRMVSALTALGVTVLLTVEVTDSYGELRLSPHGISFLTDGVILQRYVEIDAHVRKVMTVLKLAGTNHSKEIRTYEIVDGRVQVGETTQGYRGVLRGIAVPKHGADP